MPCYGPDGPPNYRSDMAEKELHRVRQQLDEATRAACELNNLMPGMSDGVWDEVSEETRKWCIAHRKLDRQRRKRSKK